MSASGANAASGVKDVAQGGSKAGMALVMNGAAGALLGQSGQAGSLQDLLRCEAGELAVIDEAAGTLPQRVAAASATGHPVVVVAGGDGTIACAAQALAGTGTALGLVPCGTMNLMAKDLGLDPADHESAVRVLGEGVRRAIDVGEVAGRDGQAHVFLCASMLGTPAKLSRVREEGRAKGNGVFAWAGFAWAAGQALLRNRSSRFVITIDGVRRRVRTPSLTITVNRLDDETGRLFGRAVLDGGTLAVYLVKRNTAWGQARLLLRTAWQGSLRAPEIEVILAERVEIDSAKRKLHVLVDGELRMLRPPLRYANRPRALNVIAPA